MNYGLFINVAKREFEQYMRENYAPILNTNNTIIDVDFDARFMVYIFCIRSITNPECNLFREVDLKDVENYSDARSIVTTLVERYIGMYHRIGSTKTGVPIKKSTVRVIR
jgi:hypothetical protein